MLFDEDAMGRPGPRAHNLVLDTTRACFLPGVAYLGLPRVLVQMRPQTNRPERSATCVVLSAQGNVSCLLRCSAFGVGVRGP